MTDLAVGVAGPAHVVTEAASAVMVLAVDIAGDRPADGDLEFRHHGPNGRAASSW